MSAGTRIGASGSLSRARELVRQGALDAADAMVKDHEADVSSLRARPRSGREAR